MDLTDLVISRLVEFCPKVEIIFEMEKSQSKVINIIFLRWGFGSFAFAIPLKIKEAKANVPNVSAKEIF